VYSFHEHHKTAIELRERFLPTGQEQMKDHPSLGTLYEELGSSYEALGNSHKSMECRKEAIRIYEGFLGDHKFTATSYLGLGTTLKSQGNFQLRFLLKH
jgi:tetratricopeptide (TPR) repeat protein